MTLYVASQLKDDLRAATLELLTRLRATEQLGSVAALFYIFDGGNGYFNIYVARGWDPDGVAWRNILEEPIAQEGSLAQVLQLSRRISEHLVSQAEQMEDDSALLEDGRTVRIGWGDEDFNLFLAQLTIEVLKEAPVHELLCLMRSPGGCTVYCADDEVQGHGRYLQHEIPGPDD